MVPASSTVTDSPLTATVSLPTNNFFFKVAVTVKSGDTKIRYYVMRLITFVTLGFKSLYLVYFPIILKVYDDDLCYTTFLLPKTIITKSIFLSILIIYQKYTFTKNSRYDSQLKCKLKTTQEPDTYHLTIL